MGTLVATRPEIDDKRISQPSHQVRWAGTLGTCILISVWFGIFAGLLEGTELLLFQRINWQQWGRMPGVTKEILWISPIVDVLAAVIVSLSVATIAWVVRRNTLRLVVSCLVFLTILDLLSVTARLTIPASVLVAAGVAISFDGWRKLHEGAMLRFWKRSCPWLVGIWMVFFSGIQGGKWAWERYDISALPKPTASEPNIVLIVIDTLRADHLSAYGYYRPTTPNIDRIAKEGVLFENAISAASWTFPSHASILTGRYPSQHGMQDLRSMRWGSANLHNTTLGEALENRGYRTGAFSANCFFFTSNAGFGQGFIHFEDYFQSPRDMFMRTSLGRRGLVQFSMVALRFWNWRYLYKRAPEVNRETLGWIDDSSERPFFVVLNYLGVHEADARSWMKAKPTWGKETESNRYDSALTYLDSEIGKLMHELQQRGIADNTLVIITSDHGQGLGQHHLEEHGAALYLEQIHVPLIIWYPGHIPAGVRVKAPVSNVAIAATIMGLVTGRSDPFPGSGLSPFWSEGFTRLNHPNPNPISELAKNGIDDRDEAARQLTPTAYDGNMKSIVTPRWHLIEHQTLGNQLYDWVHDPGELNNLINTPEGAAVAKSLEVEMRTDKVP